MNGNTGNGLRWRDDAVAIALLVAGFAAFVVMFRPILPGGAQMVPSGHALHLTNLLVGYFHALQNGVFAAPWFSPAQCAGVPYLADLNTAYHTPTQWLAFVIGPMAAIVATVYAFAAVGSLGCYGLLRGPFRLSAAASAAGAVIFLFNGMFTARMAMGDLAFHPLMLAPWIAWAMLQPPGSSDRWKTARFSLTVILVGAGLAYAFHAGMIDAFTPMVLSIAAIVLVHGIAFGQQRRPWAIYALGLVLALALSAQRLAASLQLNANFPRDVDGVAGFTSVADLLRVALAALFWRVPETVSESVATNEAFVFDSMEWDVGLGPVVPILVLGGAVVALLRGSVDNAAAGVRRHAGALTAIGIIFLLPLVLNFDTPARNGLLKSVPLIGSGGLPSPWLATYLLPFTVLAAIAIDRMSGAVMARWLASAATILLTLGWNASSEKVAGAASYFDGILLIDPGLLDASWRLTRTPADVPPVSEVRFVSPPEPAAFAFGYTDLPCEAPVFGGGTESYPRGAIREGSTLGVNLAGELNIKNPACYLFPEENLCPGKGGQFTEKQAEQALKFVTYRRFDFARSKAQRFADAVNATALLALPAVLGLAGWADAARRRRGPGFRNLPDR